MRKHTGVVVAVVVSASTLAASACGQSPGARAPGALAPDAQGLDAHASAEVAAARAMLARHAVPAGRLAIEPRFALDGHAPGWVSERSARRPTARTEALARAVGGRVSESAPLGTCASCFVFELTLSDPSIIGDTAFVSATVRYDTPSEGRNYETVRFTLVRQGGSWHVRKTEELGVS